MSTNTTHSGKPVINALSFDVEDYYHVSAFEMVVNRNQWGEYPSRVEDNMRRILDLLDQYGTKATFFVLGWVAERQSALNKGNTCTWP